MNLRASRASKILSPVKKADINYNIWEEFNRNFKDHSKKEIFVKAFAHHVANVLRKKQIVTIKHRGGYVGGPSNELQSRFRLRASLSFLFFALLWLIISIRVIQNSYDNSYMIGIPVLGILHSAILVCEMEACTFYETYSKLDRITLGFDIIKFVCLIVYILEYRNPSTRDPMAYLLLLPLIQKCSFYYILKTKFEGLYCSPLNIMMDFVLIVITMKGLYSGIK